MKKEPLTITQKSTILSLREQAKQLLREIPLKDAIADLQRGYKGDK